MRIGGDAQPQTRDNARQIGKSELTVLLQELKEKSELKRGAERKQRR